VSSTAIPIKARRPGNAASFAQQMDAANGIAYAGEADFELRDS